MPSDASFSWEVIDDLDTFEQHADAIDALADRAQLEPLASTAWTRAYWEAFGEAERVEVHVMRRGEAVVAAIPLVRSGVWPRTLRALQNEHHPYFVPAIEDDPEIVDRVLARLLAVAERLDLRRLPFDSRSGRALARAAARAGLHASKHDNGADTTIRLDGEWPAIEARFAKHLRRDGRQGRRRLAELGDLAFRTITNGPELVDRLTACFALEAAGWKGEHGAPIQAAPQTRHFYTRLAELASARDRFALYLLELAGRPIAFEYTLRGGGRLECLKIGYDEALSRHSPGTVLRMWLLETEVRDGRTRSYHLGRPSDWKRRWTDDLPPIGTLCLYAPTLRGRIAHLAGPTLRSYLKQLAALRRVPA